MPLPMPTFLAETALTAPPNPWGFQMVAALLFVLGLVGILARRNLLIMLLCSELMLQGVILNLVAFDRLHSQNPAAPGKVFWDGQAFSLFILVVAAAEAALGLAVVVLLFRRRRTLDAGAWRMLSN